MGINDDSLNYTELARKVLSMLLRNTGQDADDGKRNKMGSGVKDSTASQASGAMTAVDDHLTLNNWEWPTGVALYSMYKLADRSGDREFYDYLLQWYDSKLLKSDVHKNVNTVAPMLALACLYEDEPRPQWRVKIQEWVDWIMLEMPRTTYGGLQHMTVLNRHYQQLWDDTLFMTVLFLAKAGGVLGCETLVDEAKYQFLIHIKYLQDKLTGLFYHGWTFDYKHNFANVFWARGNSWFTAGAVEFLEICGNRDSVFRYVLSCLEDQVKELVKHQGENGLFTTILDSEESYSETSATANIAYGILKGIRLGLLDGGYAAAGQKAARAVIDQISGDGTVQGVSYGTGMGTSADHYRKIPIRPTAYGQGLCLLLLSELV